MEIYRIPEQIILEYSALLVSSFSLGLVITRTIATNTLALHLHYVERKNLKAVLQSTQIHIVN
jgi:hypothetical protein